MSLITPTIIVDGGGSGEDSHPSACVGHLLNELYSWNMVEYNNDAGQIMMILVVVAVVLAMMPFRLPLMNNS